MLNNLTLKYILIDCKVIFLFRYSMKDFIAYLVVVRFGLLVIKYSYHAFFADSN